VNARALVAGFVATDLTVTAAAWLAAYYLRFYSETVARFLPVTKGVPDVWRYVLLLPLIVIIWPVVLYFHGLYQLRRGRSRIDEFFGILFSVLISTTLTLGATLYVRVYYRYQPAVAPQWEYSQGVFAIFVVLNILALNLGRAALRAYLERMWAAGYNVKRVLVAGTGELGRTVAASILAHAELGYRVIGFVGDDERREVDGLPMLGGLDDIRRVADDGRVDQLYIALPLEQHSDMLRLIKSLRNECVDVKVVPDLLQYATIQASLEDLDGIPIINLNDVPLRGFGSMIKRTIDLALAATALVALTVIPVLPVICLLIKLKGGKGSVLLRQERMTLEGKTFQIYKFRTMVDEAEKETGPVFATSDDPRRTSIGVWLRRFNLDEIPQILNVLKGDMSLVGPRPERPPFVEKFRERIPQYMMRHRVKSGITGWAQVNGWRGNTSIEKRIEYDLYYIENWSLLLDIKILILTLFRGFGQKHAY